MRYISSLKMISRQMDGKGYSLSSIHCKNDRMMFLASLRRNPRKIFKVSHSIDMIKMVIFMYVTVKETRRLKKFLFILIPEDTKQSPPKEKSSTVVIVSVVVVVLVLLILVSAIVIWRRRSRRNGTFCFVLSHTYLFKTIYEEVTKERS